MRSDLTGAALYRVAVGAGRGSDHPTLAEVNPALHARRSANLDDCHSLKPVPPVRNVPTDEQPFLPLIESDRATANHELRSKDSISSTTAVNKGARCSRIVAQT